MAEPVISDTVKLILAGTAYFVVQLCSNAWTTYRTRQAAKKLEINTAHPEQVERLAAQLKKVQEDFDARLDTLEGIVKANANAVPGMIQKALAELAVTVQSQITNAFKGFATGKAMSDKTVIEGDKK